MHLISQQDAIHLLLATVQHPALEITTIYYSLLATVQHNTFDITTRYYSFTARNSAASHT